MKKNIAGLLGVFILASFTAAELPSEFTNLLQRSKLEFITPDVIIATQPIANNKIKYEYALKHPSKNYEVRYAIRPLDEEIKSYNEREKNKNEGDINIHPNNWYKTVFEATIMNITGGIMYSFNEFPLTDVKAEFNADWGAASTVEVVKEFGQEYTYCMLVFLHKDNVGDVYLFFMGDKEETIHDLMDYGSHSVKFK